MSVMNEPTLTHALEIVIAAQRHNINNDTFVMKCVAEQKSA